MILEFDEIGRIDVEEVFYKDGDYILSGRDKRKVERKLMERLHAAVLTAVRGKWCLVTYLREPGYRRSDVCVLSVESDVPFYTPYTY